MASLSFDTCFLIDLERERRKATIGPARRFLDRHARSEVCISVVVLAEFGSGFEQRDHPVLDAVRTGFRVLPADAETAWIYATRFRNLRDRRALIGANDLWIAATALQHQLPLVTRDEREFSRISDLDIVVY